MAAASSWIAAPLDMQARLLEEPMVAPVDILAYAMTPSNGEDTIASERLFEGDDTFCILRRFVQHSWRLALQRGTALLALGSRGAGGAPSWAVFPMRLVSASGARLLCVAQREPSSRPSWRLTSVVAESNLNSTLCVMGLPEVPSRVAEPRALAGPAQCHAWSVACPLAADPASYTAAALFGTRADDPVTRKALPDGLLPATSEAIAQSVFEAAPALAARLVQHPRLAVPLAVAPRQQHSELAIPVVIRPRGVTGPPVTAALVCAYVASKTGSHVYAPQRIVACHLAATAARVAMPIDQEWLIGAALEESLDDVTSALRHGTVTAWALNGSHGFVKPDVPIALPASLRAVPGCSVASQDTVFCHHSVVSVVDPSLSVVPAGTRVRFRVALDSRKRSPDEPLVASAVSGERGPIAGLERAARKDAGYNGAVSSTGGVHDVGDTSIERFRAVVQSWTAKGFGFLKVEGLSADALPAPTSASDARAHERLREFLSAGVKDTTAYCHVLSVAGAGAQLAGAKGAKGAKGGKAVLGLARGSVVSCRVARNLRESTCVVQAVDVRAADGTSLEPLVEANKEGWITA
ncbi:hypothetical protein FNF29_05618 [Cafeteria roenbergensis]|uniref:DUF3825 domain-containing protein n=1 Tax=Cafeteria roenbergensis TaxID=33653 RepID=A0A5A8CAY2_CAFRO|nr:hypothetical protein FNF29_05618 [Cafeteria roenbergensis]|eukprot:KAA0149998.1 hypothetical protein FNF29_05618 [Cafeteria roenbergensis]